MNLSRRMARVSDLLLERVVPRASAAAVVCTKRVCRCAPVGGQWVLWHELWDEQHDTRCSSCQVFPNPPLC